MINLNEMKYTVKWMICDDIKTVLNLEENLKVI